MTFPLHASLMFVVDDDSTSIVTSEDLINLHILHITDGLSQL